MDFSSYQGKSRIFLIGHFVYLIRSYSENTLICYPDFLFQTSLQAS